MNPALVDDPVAVLARHLARLERQWQAIKDPDDDGPEPPSLADARAAHAAVVELVAAARYIGFAMRDGAVFARDHAAQRLADALVPFPE